MLLQQFPDLQWLKKQAEDNFANRKDYSGRTLPTAGWPSVILNVKAGHVIRDNIRGPLSLFTNFSGVSTVACDRKNAVIHEGFFYLTNHDQRYTLEIDRTQSAETCNIHFGEYWADEALASLVDPTESLLENKKFIAPHARIEFHNKLYRRSTAVTTLLLRLKSCGENRLLEEQILYDILVLLLREQQDVRKSEQRLPLVRNSTRQEIIKQLNTSTDYIHSFYHKDISLDELAEVASISKFHFLRLFKTAFDKTPHQFITEVKMENAKAKLKNTKVEVIELSRQLGFKDASTFSRAFKRHVGVWPTQFR